MSLLRFLLAVLALSHLAGCASNRRLDSQVEIVTEDDPDLQAEKSPEDTPSQTSPPEAAAADGLAVELLVRKANDLFSKGEALFAQGRTEPGRRYFLQSLETLDNSQFDLFSHPEIEQAYYVLLSQIEKWELQALIDPTELELPEFELTPSDEIAELNLFSIEVDPNLKELVNEDLLTTRFDIPVVLNDSVLRFLNYYQQQGRGIMEQGLRRSGRYLSLFRKIFQKEGVPLDLVYMAHVESLFKPYAYSRARAKGIWQFISSTARLYDLRIDWWIDERSDIIKSTQAAARHLKDLYANFEDWNLALAAYNAGARRIERVHRRYGRLDYWQMVKRKLLPRETRHHVPSILAASIIFRHPERYGFDVEPAEEIQFETIALKEQVDLRVAAEAIGVSTAELAELNPELRRGITPFNYREYQLKVPVGKGSLLEERLAALPAEKKVRFRHHKVRRGDTLSRIAQSYSTSIQAIAHVNRIRNVHRLREGQDLVIPLSGSPSSGWLRTRRTLPNTYVVRRGDSLSQIARLYGVNIQDLLRWNNLKLSRTIHPGQRIKILGKAELGAKRP